MNDDDLFDDQVQRPFGRGRMGAAMDAIASWPRRCLDHVAGMLRLGRSRVDETGQNDDDEAATELHPSTFFGRMAGAMRTPFEVANQWLAARTATKKDDGPSNFEEEPAAKGLAAKLSPAIRLAAFAALPLVFAWRLVAGLVMTLADTDRVSRELLKGLPALLCVLCIVSLAFIGGLESEQSLKLRYLKEASDAYRSEDFERARVAYRRILKIDPNSNESLYGLGLVMEKLKNPEFTAAAMERLAPADAAGYGPAHLWRARAYLARENDAEALKKAEAHLVRAMGFRPTNREAELLLAMLYAQTGRGNLAEPILIRHASEHVDAAFELARIQAARGDLGNARAGFQRAAAEYQRQIEQRPDNLGARLKLAQASALNGDFAVADRTLHEGLAVDPTGGFRLQIARLYIGWADTLTGSAAAERRKGLLQSAVEHLKALNPPRVDAAAMLGGAYARLGRMDLAEPQLVEAAKSRPELHLELAQYFAENGNGTKARSHATKYLAQFGGRARDPAAPDELVLKIANAELLCGNYAEAVAVLSERQKRGVNPAVVRGICRVLLLWHDDRSGANAHRSEAERQDLLARVLAIEPWNVPAISRLMAAGRGKDPQVAAAARATLRQLSARGNAPAAVHLLLGNDAFARGDRAAAEAHLKQAYSLDPKAIEIANNLAWLSTIGPAPDLEQALRLINSALAQRPDHPELLDTRGQILTKMGKWNEALIDLEKCKAAKRGDPQYHRALCEVYGRLGMAELAADQQKILKQLTAPPSDRQDVAPKKGDNN